MPQQMPFENIAIMLLAAGGSARLGHPKQMVNVNGKSLLQNSIDAALNTGADPLVVVLGANAALIEKEIEGDAVQIVYNEEWQEGMAASIRSGITQLQQMAPLVESVVLMVCDQPHVSAALLHSLIDAHKATGKPIVTCSFADTFGPPTLFHKSLFPELMQLKGDVGARSILNKHPDWVVAIPFAEGVVDIDTEEDFLKFKNA